MRAFRIAYDGAPYYGFQRQPDVETVEGVLFDALDRLVTFEGEKPAGYAAAGRTDRGVSALAQTVAFEAPEWLTPAAFNSELPGTVRAWASADAPDDFHARYDARSRTYAYYLHAPGADVEAIRGVLSRLSGTHDFHNLTPEDGPTTRTITRARANREGPFVVLTLRADGFLKRLVRRVVTLVVDVLRSERDPTYVERVLSKERLSGPEGIASAPSEPLVLVHTAYDLDFEIDARAAESAREVFEEKRVDRETGARVAGRIAGELDG
ncbi:tRNA pseudouridine(38-40) synthase TruA [Halalkalicoccus jeotgali]|uniref:tRNA pseudouridine synthase A n=1 Tax=Halalkalicoccus jeotgali (strain DSM 18796 / CECT 7217 / JCM 14584 / KCTC 4019 / B3) TaxID=795797 RepID=D8J8W5_HALJB|nr:tRNA pseudouridine(38-40) synthase TruA [Halalkalicoccus jeotgali]ADJ14300.1 tRNA pseudouridine synthase A [Halalkalicoccus jeotgali B3]ELY40563.1 tRNA pseudouridine synthase A [Halalkalicoccus jeotgali B3]